MLRKLALSLPALVFVILIGSGCCAQKLVVNSAERLEKMDSTALELLSNNAEADPADKSWACYLIGIRALNSGDGTRGETALVRATELQPDGRASLHAQYELAKYHEGLLATGRDEKRYTQAVELYTAIAEKYPGNELSAFALHRAASLASSRRQLAQAIFFYEKLVKDYRRYRALPDAVLGYLNCLTRTGNTAAALKVAEEFKGGFPDSPDFLRRLKFAIAVARERAGELDTAKSLFEALIRDEPGSQEAALAIKTLERFPK